MTTTIKTTLRIVGSFDPEEVTQALSLQPTLTWRKGDIRGGVQLLRYNEDGWSLTIRQRPALHVDEELAAVLSLLRPHAQRLREILHAHRLRGQVCVAVDVAEDQLPSITLSPSDMSELAGMNLSVDIDIV